jgi:hypothetical protein
MCILVMESINALPDRVLLVQEARKRALTEPWVSIFTRNGIEYFHLMTLTGVLLVGVYRAGKAMPGSVAVTHDTWARIKDRFEGESLGELEIKGILTENAPSRGG